MVDQANTSGLNTTLDGAGAAGGGPTGSGWGTYGFTTGWGIKGGGAYVAMGGATTLAAELALELELAFNAQSHRYTSVVTAG